MTPASPEEMETLVERYREALIEARGELLRQQRGGDPDKEEHCRSIIEHIARVLTPEAAASDQGETP